MDKLLLQIDMKGTKTWWYSELYASSGNTQVKESFWRELNNRAPESLIQNVNSVSHQKCSGIPSISNVFCLLETNNPSYSGLKLQRN